jgi:hypothetical protein
MSTSATEGIILFNLLTQGAQHITILIPIIQKHGSEATFSFANSLAANWLTANPHSPVHHEGWMISGQETVFCWVSVP